MTRILNNHIQEKKKQKIYISNKFIELNTDILQVYD